jgi:hypothetical protein
VGALKRQIGVEEVSIGGLEAFDASASTLAFDAAPYVGINPEPTIVGVEG